MITDPGPAPPSAAGDPAAAAAAVHVSGLRKRYGDVAALAGVELVIGAGEFFAARPLRVWQDDAAAPHCRVRAARRRLGQQLPEVNAVVTIVILLTIIPVVLAARLAGAGAISRSAAAATAAGRGG